VEGRHVDGGGKKKSRGFIELGGAIFSATQRASLWGPPLVSSSYMNEGCSPGKFPCYLDSLQFEHTSYLSFTLTVSAHKGTNTSIAPNFNSTLKRQVKS